MFEFTVDFNANDGVLKASLVIQLSENDLEEENENDSQDDLANSRHETALEIAEEIFESIDLNPCIGDYYNDVTSQYISGTFEFEDLDLETKSIKDNSLYFFKYYGTLGDFEGSFNVSIDKSLVRERFQELFPEKDLDEIEVLDLGEWEDVAEELAEERAIEILEEVEFDPDYSLHEQIYQDSFNIEVESHSMDWDLDISKL